MIAKTEGQFIGFSPFFSAQKQIHSIILEKSEQYNFKILKINFKAGDSMWELDTQLTVIGGGPAGVCAALSAARLGVPTVLIGNRPVLGGNSSSEIRVWTRGAVGAGNLFAEEMGVWGLLKLENLYKNPDANPVFWDEILLDAVLAQENLRLLLNTDVTEVERDKGQITAVLGTQQGTERRLRVRAKYFVDATGDGSIGARAGLPYYIGTQRVDDGGQGTDAELLGSSILYYTRREDHPVRFVPPAYAYSLEKVERLIGSGGRVVSERLSGSDCWWFEYGGAHDTIAAAQDIAIELKRLVLGVWNYIKNSGKFDADCYTLDWIGSLPGKRESRRMETEYLLTQRDLLEGQQFPDGAFYGGWYMDLHPAGGILDSQADSCVQIPVHVYQIPLRCLYHGSVSNLLFAGRNIGTERDAFASSRIMNTCALSGQAAGTLAGICIARGRPPAELSPDGVEEVRQTLLREDMFIPGVPSADKTDLAPQALVSASSFHDGSAVPLSDGLELTDSAFAVFPGIAGGRVTLTLQSQTQTRLTGTLQAAMLPNRFLPGRDEGPFTWDLQPGEQQVELTVPESCGGRFCILRFDVAPGVRLALAEEHRAGFLCGHELRPEYASPMIQYRSGNGQDLYTPGQVLNGCSRPWGQPNQWCAAPTDRDPWLRLDWPAPITLRELRLYLDPDLTMELPSSRAQHWEESHHYALRAGMPPRLVKSIQAEALDGNGGWQAVWNTRENHQRLVVVRFSTPIKTSALRLRFPETWGKLSPAVYEVRAY